MSQTKRKKAETRSDRARNWKENLHDLPEPLLNEVVKEIDMQEASETKTLNCPKCGSKDVKEDKLSQSVDVENWQSMPISINTWGYKCQKCGTFFSVQEG